MSSSLQAAMDMGILASSEPRPTMTTLPPATQARMPVCSSTHTACQRVAGRSSSVGVTRLGSVPLPFVKLVCAALAVMMSQLSISCSVVHQHPSTQGLLLAASATMITSSSKDARMPPRLCNR